MPVSKHGLSFIALIFSTCFLAVSHAALPTHDSSGRALPSLAPMLKQVNPAVVNIATYAEEQLYNPLLNDPFFRYFFNVPETRQPQTKKRQQSAGSGVIVDAQEGVIITNYHVIKGADEVHVSLTDGRNYKAKIVGVDPELDVAVIKIQPENLTAVKLADSSQLEVGDFVVAIGNPFALGQTVTTGVVSALGRTGLGIEGYENFIQTDASINPGNSGGALVDLNGKLIGINTAIIAPSGGNVGIGFAIPINMVRSAMNQILKFGKVRRGDIGLTVQDISHDLRQAFNLPNGQRGVLVTGVNDGSTAEKSGIKPGDVIVAIDGEATTSSGQLRSQLGVKGIDDNIAIEIIRESRTMQFIVRVAEPRDLAANLPGTISRLLEGARFENHSSGQGVVVSSIAPNSNAGYSGLRQGDIVISANRRRVTDLDSFQKALSGKYNNLLLQINRNGYVFFLVIRQ